MFLFNVRPNFIALELKDMACWISGLGEEVGCLLFISIFGGLIQSPFFMDSGHFLKLGF
jgi:hypothetical protein